MWSTRNRLIFAHLSGFLLIMIALIWADQSQSIAIIDPGFWAIMVFLVMRFESEMNDVVISQIDLVAVVMVFLLPPWLAALLVAVFSFSNAIWQNPRFRWSTELMNHLTYGICTGVVGLLYLFFIHFVDYELLSWGALILICAGMGVFYVANVAIVALATVTQKPVTLLQFLRQNAAGFPVYSLLVSPLAYLSVVLYQQSPLGGWGGWAILVLMMPLFYAQYLITRNAYKLSAINTQMIENEQSYQDLIESLPVGLYRVKPDGALINANTALAHILGFDDRESLLQHNTKDLYVEQEDRQNYMQEIVQDIKNAHILHLKRPNGEHYQVRDTTNAQHDDDGNLLYIDGVVEDITDQQRIEHELAKTNHLIHQAKQEWEATVDSLPDLVCLLDVNKTIIRSNRMIEQWQLAPVNDVAGKPINDILQQYKAILPTKILIDQAWVSLKRQEAFTVELRHRQTAQVVIAQFRPLKDTSFRSMRQRDSFAVLTLHDVTESKQLEEALRDVNSTLEARVRERTEQLEREIQQKENLMHEIEQALIHEQETNAFRARFSTMISHEFRTPLTIIQSSIDLIDRAGDRLEATRRTEIHQRIRNQIRHLVNLLDDIMTISKADTVGIDGTLEWVDLPLFSQRMAVEMRQLIKPEQHLTIHLDNLPDKFYLDAKLIRQMTANLISNAVKYSGINGKIRLEIIGDEDGITLSVTDNGIGIPPEARNHLFDAFYRAQNVGMISGTGIGLAIVKLVVDLHKGTIVIESPAGGGTQFIVRLPLKQRVTS
jgi:PAS domain S-box-containing protein